MPPPGPVPRLKATCWKSCPVSWSRPARMESSGLGCAGWEAAPASCRRGESGHVEPRAPETDKPLDQSELEVMTHFYHTQPMGRFSGGRTPKNAQNSLYSGKKDCETVQVGRMWCLRLRRGWLMFILRLIEEQKEGKKISVLHYWKMMCVKKM